MRKHILLLLLLFSVSYISNAQVVLNWKFADGLGSLGTTGTVAAGAWAGVSGYSISSSSSIYFNATGLAPGNYELKAKIMVQDLTNTPFNQQVWPTSGSLTIPVSNQTGTAGSYVYYTQNVTVTDANSSFGIVRGAGGFQMFVNEWTITSLVPSSEKDITSFSFSEQTGAATINAAAHTVNIEVRFSADITNLTPTIGISAGASINPTSGTAGNFSGPATYTVTAADGSTQNWTVNVTRAAASTAKNIVTFTHPYQTGAATIGANTVTLQVDPLADLSALSPNITLSGGATIVPNSGISQNFTGGPVNYTVTAEDGSTKVYAVTVTTDNTVSTVPCSVKVP